MNMTKNMTFPTQTKQTEKTQVKPNRGKKKMGCVVKLLSKISKVPMDGRGIGLLTSLSPSFSPSLSPISLSPPRRQ